MKSLTNLMLKMAEGNLDLNIPVVSKKGSNEIYEMASTIDFFQRNLIKRYENERLLDIVANNTTSVIYFKDKEGRYLFTNERWNKLFGKDCEEVKGKTDFDLFPKEFAEKFVEKDRDVIKSGRPFNGEEIAPHDDVIHTYFSSKVPLLDEQEKIYGLCGVSTDITEKKDAEKRLKKSDKNFSICLISCQSVSICKQVTTVFPMPIKCFAIGLETLKIKNVIRHCTTEKYPVTRAPLLELLIPKKQNQVYGNT